MGLRTRKNVKVIITQKLLPRLDQRLGKRRHLLVFALLADGINRHPDSCGLWKDTVSVCFLAGALPVLMLGLKTKRARIPEAAPESWGCYAAPSVGPKPQSANEREGKRGVLKGCLSPSQPISNSASPCMHFDINKTRGFNDRGSTSK